MFVHTYTFLMLISTWSASAFCTAVPDIRSSKQMSRNRYGIFRKNAPGDVFRVPLGSEAIGVPNPVYFDDDGVSILPSSGVSRSLVKECLGEITGTAIIIGFGTAACATALTTGSADLGVAVVWAWIIAAMISSLSHVSGAHFNPAISIATKVLFPRTMTWHKVMMYSLSQFVGAFIGSAITLKCFATSLLAYEKRTGVIRNSLTGHKSASVVSLFYPYPNLANVHVGFPSMLTAVLLEIVGTGLLAFVAFSLGHPQNKIRDTSGIKPITIGFTVGVIATVIGPITMAGLNPARDLGPRLACILSGWGTAVLPRGGLLGSLIVYTIGPIIGAILGGSLAQILGDHPENL